MGCGQSTTTIPSISSWARRHNLYSIHEQSPDGAVSSTCTAWKDVDPEKREEIISTAYEDLIVENADSEDHLSALESHATRNKTPKSEEVLTVKDNNESRQDENQPAVPLGFPILCKLPVVVSTQQSSFMAGWTQDMFSDLSTSHSVSSSLTVSKCTSLTGSKPNSREQQRRIDEFSTLAADIFKQKPERALPNELYDCFEPVSNEPVIPPGMPSLPNIVVGETVSTNSSWRTPSHGSQCFQENTLTTWQGGETFSSLPIDFEQKPDRVLPNELYDCFAPVSSEPVIPPGMPSLPNIVDVGETLTNSSWKTPSQCFQDNTLTTWEPDETFSSLPVLHIQLPVEMHSTFSDQGEEYIKPDAKPWNMAPLPAAIEPKPTEFSEEKISTECDKWSEFLCNPDEFADDFASNKAEEVLPTDAEVSPATAGPPLPEIVDPARFFGKTSSVPFLSGKMPLPDQEIIARTRTWVPIESLGDGANWGRKHVARMNTQVLFVVWEACTGQSQSAVIEEAKRLKKIRHRHLSSVQDYDILSGKPVVFMDFASDGTINDRFQRIGPFDEAYAAWITAQVLSALAYLHNVNIVHGALKGSNVGLSEGAVKLLDWGWSMRYERTEKAQAWLRSSFRWLAPEIIQSRAPSSSSDVWSLGCLIIEMLTAAPPWAQEDFPSDTTEALKYIGISDSVPKIPHGTSGVCAEILKHCLHRLSRRRKSSRDLLNHAFVEGALQRFCIMNDTWNKGKSTVWRSLKVI